MARSIHRAIASFSSPTFNQNLRIDKHKNPPIKVFQRLNRRSMPETYSLEK